MTKEDYQRAKVIMQDLRALDNYRIPLRSRRKYKIRICDECVSDIKAYCKERIE